MSAKDIIVKPIAAKDARRLVKKIHYSGKVVANSVLHLGGFLNGRLEGVMQYGGSIDKRRMLNTVKDSKWNDFIELNRMAFSERLPKNSESRAIGVSIRLIKKHYPHIKWIVSFADGCQCGDGAIYRASGFDLIGIKKNTSLLMTPSGEVVARKTFDNHVNGIINGLNKKQCEPIEGYQLKYIYFIDKTYKEKLTVPILPFSKIKEMGAGMYKGIKRGLIEEQQAPPDDEGASPISALHITKQTGKTYSELSNG